MYSARVVKNVSGPRSRAFSSQSLADGRSWSSRYTATILAAMYVSPGRRSCAFA
jgi:hypothetical protein